MFGGSGTVLMNRPIKRGCMEVYNDYNSNLVKMCESQCEDCDYDCISELLNSAVDSACMDVAKQYNSVNKQNDAYEAATSVINGFVDGHGCLKDLLRQYIEDDACGK